MSDPQHDPEGDEAVGMPTGAKLPEIEPPPDFLAGVQSKIRRRSGGKFYRSRWSTSPNSTLVRIVVLAMLLAIVIFWLMSGPVRDLGPDEASPPERDGQELRPPVKIRSSGSGSPESPPSPPPR